jgi:pyruvate formate lyase activating enzyme
MREALLYKKLPNKKVQCTACAHYCQISEDKAGICGVRKNIDGKLFLLVYGKAIAVNVDPIEKKPLFHFLPGSKIFSLGTVGCNLRCSFCQNWDISQLGKGEKLKVGNLGDSWPPEKIVDYCLENKIPSIAFTYNEPTILFEYTYDTAKLAHAKGLKVVYVTNGYASSEAIEKISPYLDAINIDLKSFNSKFYQKVCGAKLEPVLDSIKLFHKKKVWVEITTLIVPNQNDSEKELTQIAEFIASVSKTIPWHISRFYPSYKMMDGQATPEATFERAYNIGRKAGLRFIYTGNINNEKLESTFCPKCQKLLIKRFWNSCDIIQMKNGKCQNCGTQIEGIWK